MDYADDGEGQVFPPPYGNARRFFGCIALRSFRTYMSIEKRASPTARSFRSLIKNTRCASKPIKDLKDLSVLRGHACYRHSGPTDLKRTRDVFFGERAMARDRPSPYVKGNRFFIVVRGPSDATRASERVSPASVRLRGRWRGTGPRPTMKSRPGGLSYGDTACIETGRALRARFMKYPQ